MNECLVLTLLFLMNNPETRCYVRPDVGLEVLIAIVDVGCSNVDDVPYTLFSLLNFNSNNRDNEVFIIFKIQR
jgi:hypothetical protein